MEKLVGKTITNVEVSVCKDYLRITTTDGTYQFMAYGECCSNTWIEDTSVDGKLGTVIAVEDVHVDPSKFWEDEDQTEFIQAYATEIRMDSGTIRVEYRNSSNGYYGGELISEGTYAWESPHKDTRWREPCND